MTDQGKLDRAFRIVERAAILGQRCPPSNWERLPFQRAVPRPDVMVNSTALTALAKQGMVLIEISGRNYRTVTILVGPNAGRKTAPDPSGAVIWQTIGRVKTLNTGAGQPRQGPSAPRRIA